jgi:hypothetical protein
MNNADYAKILQALSDNTYAAKTTAPHQLPEWRKWLIKTRAEFAAREDDCANEVAFMDDLLAVLADQPLKLSTDSGYGNVVRQIRDAIHHYHQKGDA